MTVLQQLEKMASRMSGQPAIRHSILQTAHVLRYPMKDILAQIPGDTLKDRAEKIGVSRQTMYVWIHEKFRPNAIQAKAISKLTGVPVWQIRDLLEDGDGDDRATRTTRAQTRGRVAKDVKGVSPRQRGGSAPRLQRARDKSSVG